MPRLKYLSAKSREEALALLSSMPEPAVIAGGTDLVVRMRNGESFGSLVDISALSGIEGVAESDGRLVIGAGTTHGRLASDWTVRKHCPALALACSEVGSPQIRSAGTIGGNLVNASPAADSLAPLLVHGATVTCESVRGERTEALERFITAPYKTTIEPDELLTSISVEALEGYEEGYRRVAKRAAWAISRLSCAWALKVEDGLILDVRIAVGSCTPMPFRALDAEGFLKGKRREGQVIGKAAAMVTEEITGRSGMRPSFAYKLPVVRDILSAALGGGPCS